MGIGKMNGQIPPRKDWITSGEEAAAPSTLTGRTKALFWAFAVMLPLATAGLLYEIYRSLTPDEANVAATLSQQVKTYLAELRSRLGELTDTDKDAYARNWAEAVHMVPVPGVTASFMPNIRGPNINTNDLGFRGKENYAEQIERARRVKASGGRVIFWTGGSTAQGAYSTDDETSIVGYLNAFAKQTGQNFVFFNFAQGSFTSAEELGALLTYGIRLRPDLLITLDGFNDALRISADNVYHMAVGVPIIYLGLRQPYPVKFTSEWLDRIYDVPNIGAAEIDELVNHYSQNLTLMARTMRFLGGKVLFTNQPVAGHKNLCWRGYFPAETPPERFFPNLERLQVASRTVAEREGGTYLDVTDLFKDQPENCGQSLWVDVAHMNSRGQLDLARLLFTEVVKQFQR